MQLWGPQSQSIPFQAAEGTGFSQVRIHPGSLIAQISLQPQLFLLAQSLPCLPSPAIRPRQCPSPGRMHFLSAPPWVNARLRGSFSEPLDQKKPSASPQVECKQQCFSRNWGRPGRWPGNRALSFLQRTITSAGSQHCCSNSYSRCRVGAIAPSLYHLFFILKK